ncbi:MAG: hypothetical protein A2633_01850 [Candidatus Sungbacteria bacterium RIFCSPHIGHO2_01_FULL_47_32]|uniref:Uncharacterized protein n=1 Tax=Candidatus Sungbacteria bacterium RIFCSPHIGHO2_01_FULL_47_32 TaxID=1802264 RepID=A0A1G2K8E5_9BACT|nr:MAG: hypothetical protein UX72_C0052G0003 [Parcubacteria group bacterium GW2011_GWA2_47_10]OGZ95702.1 MAG: hypothetical protein A2633_01850 [Candidatus Sungbacteria bacterium RIFCSPHIGHO2_01_FULL_47_32]OGZ98556.1 MAG: hypothetical protein A3D57_04395 [Candidatus Sungbacteria bacterium RIFCSPHIGHO2_02_FULL_46_12]
MYNFRTICPENILQLLRLIGDFIFKISIPVAIVAILYAAFLYLTAGGSEQKVKAAHQTLMWTVAGIAIVLAAAGLVMVVCDFLNVKSGMCTLPSAGCP